MQTDISYHPVTTKLTQNAAKMTPMTKVSKKQRFNLHSIVTCLSAINVFLLLKSVNCFNLESRLPIVKYGEENSYFGYSVATHIIGEKNDTFNTKWLLVGAPLGQNLQPQTNHSGALYKCPITQFEDDCEQVITDGRRRPGGAYESYSDDDEDFPLIGPYPQDEIKNGQWLGVTVRSQGAGGKVLVCAHRYILKKGESQYGQGLCYVLRNDLQFDENYEPCKGRSVVRAHEDYGYCQVGTSGALLDDDTVILGTPGPYTWRGTVFVISIGGEYLQRDKIQYYGPHTETTSPVDKYSYLGMAVTGGRYFGSHMSYVAGAPRSMDHGQVIIFSKNTTKNANPMVVTAIIDGEQFASSFGYELTTADVNGDGLPDLLVSAPFYFTRHEGGAVYVYQNENYNLPSLPTMRLTGKLESRFGLALTNLGDINRDGCDDIAVGAPYENDGVVYIYLGTKNGLSKEPSQIITASDVGGYLKTFGSSLSGGTDLDGNSYPDLLIGAYSSSAVIALLARPITNIKTAVQSTELANVDPSKQGCLSDPTTNLTCFSFKACCSIEPIESSSLINSLDLMYTIEAETFNDRKKFSRVFFGPDLKSRNNIIKRTIKVKSNGIMECREEIVYIKEHTRDIQSPIKFRLNYTFVEPVLKSSGLIGLNPILDQTQADRPFEASFQKDCGSDDICESQLEVFADLKLERDEDDQYTLILGKSDELQLNVTVSNREDSAYEAQLFVEHQPSVTYIAASKGAVICNRFNETIVACTLGNPLGRDAIAQVTLRFDPSGLEDSEPKLNFQIFANSTSKQITPLNNTMLAVRVVKRAELSIKGWARPEQSFYGGEVKGESAMKYLDDIGTSLQHTYQIYNDGPWRAPYLEVHIMWPHQVANDKPQGKWLLYLETRPVIEGAGGGECFINPGTLINPLSLTKRPSLMTSELVDAPTETYIRKPHNKSYTFSSLENYEKTSAMKSSEGSGSTLNRVRRDRAMIIRSEKLIDEDGKKSDIVHMDCVKNTAKCIKFHCVIYNMQRKSEAYIHVKARLWNSTLVSDYPRVDLVNVVSRAEIIIPEIYGIQQNKIDDSVAVETRAYPELMDQAGDTSLPIWIIIVAVVSGLLVLALFIYILWKCGFFKRRRPADPTLSGNLEKNSESKPFISK